jgi:hypothetical protein
MKRNSLDFHRQIEAGVADKDTACKKQMQKYLTVYLIIDGNPLQSFIFFHLGMNIANYFSKTKLMF